MVPHILMKCLAIRKANGSQTECFKVDQVSAGRQSSAGPYWNEVNKLMTRGREVNELMHCSLHSLVRKHNPKHVGRGKLSNSSSGCKQCHCL
jgi:hypothetical protein